MKFMKQLAVIMTISFLAELMEYFIPLPVAASVYGLVLMLIGLITKLIPLEKVEGAADFLVEIMPILFVPPTVSIIANIDALKEMLVPLVVICVLTTILIMGVTGRVTQGIMSGEQNKSKRPAKNETGRGKETAGKKNPPAGSVKENRMENRMKNTKQEEQS